MRIPRVYIDQALNTASTITLKDQPAHYLGKVLRLGTESPVILFNGDGSEYSGIISSISKKELQIEIIAQFKPETESSLHTILALGISRGERMDYAIQKSTELGVNEIVPLFTEHGEVKLKGDRLEKRRAHWQQVAISACEQSNRLLAPKVHKPVPLKDWIKEIDCSIKLIFDHRQAQKLSTGKPDGKVAILIGPEGGFSEQELDLAKNTGFKGIKLGPRVLRTETAPVAILSVLQYLWGDV